VIGPGSEESADGGRKGDAVAVFLFIRPKSDDENCGVLTETYEQRRGTRTSRTAVGTQISGKPFLLDPQATRP